MWQWILMTTRHNPEPPEQECGRTHPRCGHLLLEGHGVRCAFCLLGVPSQWQVNLPVAAAPAAVDFTDTRTRFPGFQCRPRTSGSPIILQVLGAR